MEQNTQDRKEYTKMELDESKVGDDPIALFGSWLQDAKDQGVSDHNAMMLATVGIATISCRVVLLQDFDPSGFVFHSNYNSRKSMDMERDPRVALTFFWRELERQIRIEGKVERLSEAGSDAYFASRPRESRIAAWASDQSRTVENREQLDQRYSRWTDRFKDAEVPRPLHWGGYRVIAQRIEFWQGRPNRLHDRLAYEHFTDGSWERMRLQP